MVHRHDLEALRAVLSKGSCGAHTGEVFLCEGFVGAAWPINMLVYAILVTVLHVSQERIAELVYFADGSKV